VLFVEGKGDVKAVPRLAKRLLQAESAFEILTLSAEPFRVENLGTLVKNDCEKWKRLLGAAAKQKPLAGVLLVLDGDIDKVPSSWSSYVKQFGPTFCPCHVAAILAAVARGQGAGSRFSVAVVFAMKEFETWIVAGIEGIRNIELASRRGRVSLSVSYPATTIALEDVRDAKGLLCEQVPEYKQSLDQAILADEFDLQLASTRSRSFRRMSSALSQLVTAVRNGQPVVTPTLPSKA
jgi:hypothetical protein